MDNAGDWLYIVFLAMAVISSLFSSLKKKKRSIEVLGQPDEEIVTDQEPSRGKGFWEILEEMQKEQTQPQQPPKKERRRKQQPVAAPAPSPFLSTEKSIPDSIAQQVPMKAFAFHDESSILDECDFHNITELKKAIVYSEIFNRKY